MYDVLIKNGLIVDGSGSPAYKGNIAVKDGIIAAIGPDVDGKAEMVLDAKGLEVAPGFIDSHSHSDSSALFGSSSYNYLEQGVTLQVAGQCGTSRTPFSEENMTRIKALLTEDEYEMFREKCATPATFMKAAEEAKTGTNMAYFIGHNALRNKVIGAGDEKASKEQIAQMQDYIKQAMEAGYLGYSSGLVYTPSVYGDTAELTELAKALVPYNGIYVSHIRGEGDHGIDSVKEAIKIGEDSGSKVMISHIKVMGKKNEGNSEILLKLIDEANARGVDVCADQYPYNASSAPLHSQIPPKYLVGGIPEMLKRLPDPEYRKNVLYSMFNEVDEFESAIYSAGFEGSLIVGARLTPQYVNKTIAQVAEEEGKTPIDAMCDMLLANEGIMQGIYFNQSASDMIRLMAHPKVFCGSDTSDKPDERIDFEKVGAGHPRGTATMVRRLELVRDFRLRSMEESIKNVTSDTAQALGIKGISLLKEGYPADITVFKYDELHAVADYAHPHRACKGIYWVFVNGKMAVANGRATGLRAGRVLKHL